MKGSVQKWRVRAVGLCHLLVLFFWSRGPLCPSEDLNRQVCAASRLMTCGSLRRVGSQTFFSGFPTGGRGHKSRRSVPFGRPPWRIVEAAEQRTCAGGGCCGFVWVRVAGEVVRRKNLTRSVTSCGTQEQRLLHWPSGKRGCNDVLCSTLFGGCSPVRPPHSVVLPRNDAAIVSGERRASRRYRPRFRVSTCAATVDEKG